LTVLKRIKSIFQKPVKTHLVILIDCIFFWRRTKFACGCPIFFFLASCETHSFASMLFQWWSVYRSVSKYWFFSEFSLRKLPRNLPAKNIHYYQLMRHRKTFI